MIVECFLEESVMCINGYALNGINIECLSLSRADVSRSNRRPPSMWCIIIFNSLKCDFLGTNIYSIHIIVLQITRLKVQMSSSGRNLVRPKNMYTIIALYWCFDSLQDYCIVTRALKSTIVPVSAKQPEEYVISLVQDCSISITNALQLLQPCTEPLTCN